MGDTTADPPIVLPGPTEAVEVEVTTIVTVGGQDRQDYGRDRDGRDRHCSNYHRNNWDNARRHDDHRGSGRDDRRSHQNSRNGNGDRHGGHRGHDHNMSEESRRSNFHGCLPSRIRSCGSSPSRSRSCSRLPRAIRSHSASRSVDAYHIKGVDAGHKSPSHSPEFMPDGEEA